MAKLPVISGADAVKASVPQHPELAPGTLRALIRASGMSVDEFAALL